jgi:hypothetical protein
MPADRVGPRTRMVTFLAAREKNSAPWPHELAPPTTITSLPRYSVASVSDEP